jgi:hypothetical protein
VADNSEPNQNLSAREAAQLVLAPAKDAVFEYLDAHPAANSRVQEVAIDREHMAVVVYWVGDVLDPVTDAAFELIEQQTGTPITIVPVKLSGADIRAAAAKILAEQPDARSVGHDLDTLIVRVKGPLAGRMDTYTIGGKTVPIRYEQTDLTELATRQNDANPWTGGARIKRSSDNKGCSSGFGVRFGAPANYYMLTAGHCYANGNTIQDGAGNLMGTTASRNLAIDSILIDVSSASGYMYDGTWNTTSGAREKVVGTYRVALNDDVCTSGSYTGTHCGIVVRDTNDTWVVGSTTVTGIAARPNSSTTIAAGNGDSGGPVLVNTSTARQIRATGIISVGANPVACTGQGTSTCYNFINFVPIQNAQRGGTIVTG